MAKSPDIAVNAPRPVLRQPILDLEAAHALELLHVGGDHRGPERMGMRRDQKNRRRHELKTNLVPTAEWITLSPIASRARS